MPWRESKAVEERIQFVFEHEEGGESFVDLCTRYGVSRVTGYKWVNRYEEEGVSGLWERSRAPHTVAHALSRKQAKIILEARQMYPTWGPRKLLAWLQARYVKVEWCSASTAGELLRREGLSVERIYRRRSAPRFEALEPYTEPNTVWCTDFKGWFHLGNGQRCEPWTLTDGCSRYLLRVTALPRQEMKPVWQGLKEAFREYGLPEVIRTDNGRPFAGLGLGGLSHLSVWWIKLGIRPERIRPGKPQENGRHERMHLTLKEATKPAGRTMKAQQRRFSEFRRVFNEERPHESLDHRVPAQVYRSSVRKYPERIPAVEYEAGILTKRVHDHGDISWQGQRLFLSEPLAGERVAFERIGDGLWMVRFGSMKLAKLDERKHQIRELTAEDFKP
jgi:transposase InsO family protein